jgi:hypothetical protein
MESNGRVHCEHSPTEKGGRPMAGKPKAPKSPPKYRRADTGKYTTPGYAKTHPKTTVKESK